MNDTPRRKLILVVEDDTDSRSALCTMLEALGFDHLNYASGKEALQGLSEAYTSGQRPDLALLDIMMPEMNGYELLEQLKQKPEFKTLPIIMVTAKDQDSEILEGYQFGADYYITKPFNARQLEYGIKIFIDK